jgi:hypothetical protein
MHRTSAGSAAAPNDAQDARRSSATNGMAPVTPQPGVAVERVDVPLTGAVASDAGIAGMAGPVGATRPEPV